MWNQHPVLNSINDEYFKYKKKLDCRKEEGLKRRKVLILNKKHYLDGKLKCILIKGI
uniref:Macaca fascicularis brain cDNA, clone: QflA-20133 n=2 Tax=Cercopithecinae TaxID=9528 RepID=I7GCR6_MACFA|nr:unnamed protein product [Macaca fascicularis]